MITTATDRAFGALAKEARTSRGWSQEKVAARMTRAGYSWQQSTVAKTERAARPVSVGEAAALAGLLNIDLNMLIISPAACSRCAGRPPEGFTCNGCGMTADELAGSHDDPTDQALEDE